MLCGVIILDAALDVFMTRVSCGDEASTTEDGVKLID
jgi:hypothetical protein